jgi:catechol 2,3-dioxygenase-like lactoylglutathione lyase family enzyme
LSDGQGLWIRDPEGTPLQILVAPKVSPSEKTKPLLPPVVAPGQGAAPNRKTVTAVRPRYLSHLLLYAIDVDRQVEFYSRVLGLRLSDTSKGKAHAPGLHHTSWGVGRHLLGSNYFHCVRDPWRSCAEYSFDIDFVPADLDWPAADHPPEDSLYVWGPSVPEDFVTNFEGE